MDIRAAFTDGECSLESLVRCVVNHLSEHVNKGRRKLERRHITIEFCRNHVVVTALAVFDTNSGWRLDNRENHVVTINESACR